MNDRLAYTRGFSDGTDYRHTHYRTARYFPIFSTIGVIFAVAFCTLLATLCLWAGSLGAGGECFAVGVALAFVTGIMVRMQVVKIRDWREARS